MSKRTRVIGLVIILIVIISVAVFALASRRQPGQMGWGWGNVSFYESGEVVTAPVTDWSFANEFPVTRIRTTTWSGIPYWVTTYLGGEGRRLYIFSHYYAPAPGERDLRQHFPEGRSWNGNLLRHPQMRIKIGDQIFNMRAYYVTDPREYAEASEIFYKKYDRLIAKGMRDDHGYPLVPLREEQTLPEDKRPRLFFFRLEQS